VENVYLYNIDHLEAIVRENLKSREQELGRCAENIRARAAETMARLGKRPEARGTASPPVTNHPLWRPAFG
jgi:glutamyl-tRNA reductase